MLTRETCPVCKGAYGYRYVDHEGPVEIRLCASEHNVLELSVENEHGGSGYEPENDPSLIVRHPRGYREKVTGLTHLAAAQLTLANWTELGHGAIVGPGIDGAMRAWLALPLEERCPS